MKDECVRCGGSTRDMSSLARVRDRRVCQPCYQAWIPIRDAALHQAEALWRGAVKGARAMTAEEVAKAFHKTYEELAPAHGYETREASAVPWEDVPEKNRTLMVETAKALLHARVVIAGVKGS